MNDEITTAVKVLAVLGGLTALLWICVVLVKVAKRGGGGIRALGGAALMMFGWATVRDPRNDTVAEAQDGRLRKGTHAGDPLDPDEPR